MKYLCLIYHDEAAGDALAEEARAWRAELRAGGHHIASAALAPGPTTVRVRNGRALIGDLAVAAQREQMRSFYMVEARDLNDAIRMAAHMPLARVGCIEVRPLADCCED